MATQRAETPVIGCPVCESSLRVSTSTSKRGKVALVLVCPVDGRHFRGFVNHPPFVRQVLDSLDERGERTGW